MHRSFSVSQITILLLYLLAAAAFAMSRMPRYAPRSRLILGAAVAFATLGLIMHGQDLYSEVHRANGLSVSLAGAVSMISLQLALITDVTRSRSQTTASFRPGFGIARR